ncbi:hypothetical protein [Burkholderia multivorans]|nr:hypothetical protein [Burkholderia multivorans]MBU9605544.1 hypothetical protein [Burkholderia multivorans]MBU9624992.1 hypothetical protein [Burkholderia multivorans]
MTASLPRCAPQRRFTVDDLLSLDDCPPSRRHAPRKRAAITRQARPARPR